MAKENLTNIERLEPFLLSILLRELLVSISEILLKFGKEVLRIKCSMIDILLLDGWPEMVG